MRYVSTRGDAPVVDFAEALLTGLALDGGLYVPTQWPNLVETIAELAALKYHEVATKVLWPFVEGSSIDRDALAEMAMAAYATFRNDDVVPLRQIGDDEFLLELFWGPTLSFKDVALQLVGRLFEHELARTGGHVTIVGATSGDTGSAAIEACRDRAGIELVMLHPAGRVSEVQRRQMTTVVSPNIHNVAIDGTFDDCQDLVKAMFGDWPFRERNHLAAANSINWARVAAQTVYYVTASCRLSRTGRPVSFTVPTGNFGNILAGDIARRMGAPIERLIIASNANDILTRTHATGTMAMEGVTETTSPAMDIQVSSNFERLMFELFERDGRALNMAMLEFRASGELTFPESAARRFATDFASGRATEDEVLKAIRNVYNSTGELIDPHTAVGVAVGRRHRRDGETMVYPAVAHPAKFPDTVTEATGSTPELPEHVRGIWDLDESFSLLPKDLDAVETFVEHKVRSRST